MTRESLPSLNLAFKIDSLDAQALVAHAFATGDWSEVVAAARHESRRNCQPQVWALINAGWTFELPGEPDDGRDFEPWAWYWRRPPRRVGKPGRKYLSTGQAYNAMMREKEAADA